MPFHDLTVAVIHYQTPELLDQCLDDLLPSVPGARVLVVDAGDAEPLPAAWSKDGVELLRVKNHSFAHAVNTALEACDTDYFAHLNADSVVSRTTFGDLLSVLIADPELGMTGPRVVAGNGELQNQGLPYRRFQRLLEVPAAGWHAASGRFGRELHYVRVPWLSGCLQLVRMSAVRAAGPLDESQRFTNEETDWCLRFGRAGFGCALVDTHTLHLGGTSTPKHPAFLIEGLRGSMVVSQRYAPAWWAELQRLVVWGWASLAGVFALRPTGRRAARTVQRMFRERSFDTPVFGATLAEPLLPERD